MQVSNPALLTKFSKKEVMIMLGTVLLVDDSMSQRHLAELSKTYRPERQCQVGAQFL
jgi:hypothetical protein